MRRACAWLVLLTAVGPRASAQFTPFGEEERKRPGEVAKVVMGNMAIGGVSAALQALVNKKNIPKAFLAGAVGGAVHVSGKMISMGNGTVAPISGMLVSSFGASMVGNAARGKDPFGELFVPIGPLRLRIRPHDSSRAKLSVNLFDVYYLARLLSYKEVKLDWSRSVRTGTLTFNTPYLMMDDGELIDGATLANMYVVDTLAFGQSEIRRHEFVHVQQYLFVQEVWGQPMDDLVRTRLKFLRVPRWLELGLGYHVIGIVDHNLSRKHGPLYRSREAEAYALSR